MKIIKLEAENIKRIRAVEIAPDGNLVQITGRNGQGKTSILDAIWWALDGTKNVQAAPIRNGADKAVIRLDMGELIVRRTFSRKAEGSPEYTTALSVESADGQRFKTPQNMLDAFLGALTFDPLGFSRMKPKDQFDALRTFVPDVDFVKIDGQQRADFARRTELTRVAKEKRAGAAQIAVPDDFKPVDEAALLDAISEAAEDNDRLAERKRRREDVGRKAVAARGVAAQARAQIEALKAEIENLTADAARLEAEAMEDEAKLAAAKPLPEPVDVSDLREQLDAARSHNTAGARLTEKTALKEAADTLDAEIEAINVQMKAREDNKREKIAAAKLPVEGLEFGDDMILLRGVPFEQASDAEQLRTSIAIAMAQNKDLRVIRVRDGSLLDDAAMNILAALADEHDCQVWIERVDSSGSIGFVIEDGALAQSAKKSPKAAA